MSTIQEQIAAAKAELGRLDAADRERNAPSIPETNVEDDDWQQLQELPQEREPLKVGDWLSFFASTTLHVGDDEPSSFRSVTTRYGMDIELSEELLKYNAALWDLVDDVAGQARRFKRQLFTRGRWDPKTPRWERGSHEMDQARDEARSAAFALTNENERRAALRAVDNIFGLKSTSYSLAEYNGGLR